MNFRVEYCMVTMIFTWIIYLLDASHDIYKYQGRQFLTVHHLLRRNDGTRMVTKSVVGFIIDND